MKNGQRNMAIDMMKGIGILLMMVCHLVYTEGPVRQFVYSFHMPLFFIVAGYLAKELTDGSQFAIYTKKNVRRLLLPYVITMLMLCVWGAIQAFAKHDISYFLRHLFSMLYASADAIESQWGLIYAGPMWFLVAIFLVREMFGGLQLILYHYKVKYQDEIILAASVTLSIISVLIRPYLPLLPFCIMQSLTAIAFYAVGWYVHRHPLPWWVYGLCGVVWPFAIIYGNIELESAYLAYYPLSFIGACGGACAVYILCKGIVRMHELLNTINIRHHTINIPSPLAWCGLYSLPLLCMHELEMYSGIMYSLICRFPLVEYIFGWGEMVIAILMAAIIIHIPYIKKAYI